AEQDEVHEVEGTPRSGTGLAVVVAENQDRDHQEEVVLRGEIDRPRPGLSTGTHEEEGRGIRQPVRVEVHRGDHHPRFGPAAGLDRPSWRASTRSPHPPLTRWPRSALGCKVHRCKELQDDPVVHYTHLDVMDVAG